MDHTAVSSVVRGGWELKPVVLAVCAGERPSATDVNAWPSVTKRLMSDWEPLKYVDNVV
jgi:hypothetical protein